MANPNKRKGDRAELAVTKYLQTIWPGTIKTRAGFNDDLGDIIADTPHGLLCVQVKDVASPQWKTWFQQLEDQVQTLRANTTKPVIGGLVIWKLRGHSDPGEWRAVFKVSEISSLFD